MSWSAQNLFYPEDDRLTLKSHLQGCCNSRPSSAPSSPHPAAAAAATSSSRNITTISPRRASSGFSQSGRGSASVHQASSLHSSIQSPVPSSAPNKPLVGVSPSRRSKLPNNAIGWTTSRLVREREDFFDTRVTGRSEMWAVVRMVVELVRSGDVGEAQGILDAAGCTCPTGEVWRGIFDERGAFYQVPEWAIVEPIGLVPEPEEGKDGAAATDGTVEAKESEDEEKGETGVRTEEKGKGRAVEADVGEVVKLRARLSDRGTDVQIKIGTAETVDTLIRRVHEVADVSPPLARATLPTLPPLPSHVTVSDTMDAR